jgi:hypothetical protein
LVTRCYMTRLRDAKPSRDCTAFDGHVTIRTAFGKDFSARITMFEEPPSTSTLYRSSHRTTFCLRRDLTASQTSAPSGLAFCCKPFSFGAPAEIHAALAPKPCVMSDL